MSKRNNAKRCGSDPLCKIGFPEFGKYVEAEFKTVEALVDKGEVAALGDSFVDGINALYSKLLKLRKEKWRGETCIDFKAEILSDAEGKKRISSRPKAHKVGIGAKVEFDDKHHLTNSTYLIEIMGEESSAFADKILTRIHFDVVSAGSRNTALYPIYHLQVGGDPSGGRDYAVGNDDDNHDLIKPLSYPRIPIYPLSFALFIDMIFRELGNDSVKTFIKNDYWRGVVRDNEALFLKPFLECLLRRNEISKESFASICYGSFSKT